MIKVEKTREPKSWTAHRLTTGSKYEATDDLRNRLLKDQGYICAYCMRKIPVADHGTTETSRIEHVKPQIELTSDEAMDFNNMVICCPGAMSGTDYKHTHCDRHKSEHRISFSPFDQHFIDTISYNNDGKIVSSNKVYDSELNDVLNLNIPLLKLNRKNVKEALVKILGKKEWKKGDLEKVMKIYSSKDQNGQYKEYCGVVLYYISKKLKQLL